MQESKEFCVKGRAMNTNHISLLRDTSEETNHVRYQSDDNQQQCMTLSQITGRLRLISEKMKDKRSFKATQDNPFSTQKIGEGMKDYLDDIARALLAEYNARRNLQNELLVHFEKIEHFLVAMQKDKTETFLSDRQALMKDMAGEFEGRLKQELAAQTKVFVAENKKNGQEISRQLRETVETSRYSVQLMSLQKQITNIQTKLDTDNDVAKKSLLENETQVIKPQTVLPQASVPAATLTENRVDTNPTNVDKSIIQKLATGNIDEPFASTGKFQSTDQEQLPEVFKSPDDDKINGDNFTSQTEVDNTVGEQATGQTACSSKSQTSSSKFRFRKIFTKIAALF
ncbi:hypothetical protein [uncultured Bartonella sp.]|uniref:hypothetical protein n=1 Tax=uncultured Bartonella sp. TaxID=104108 RepID=UPI0025E475C7|nr:hypothetical protein [uncultured Bartonella sp.]